MELTCGKKSAMIYVYECNKCKHEFDIVKHHTEIDRQEHCPLCKNYLIRLFKPNPGCFMHTVSHDGAEYNPGLGCVVKNKKHKDYLLKEKNLVEIGNDFKSADSMIDSFDKAREEKREKSWEDV